MVYKINKSLKDIHIKPDWKLLNIYLTQTIIESKVFKTSQYFTVGYRQHDSGEMYLVDYKPWAIHWIIK